MPLVPFKPCALLKRCTPSLNVIYSANGPKATTHCARSIRQLPQKLRFLSPTLNALRLDRFGMLRQCKASERSSLLGRDAGDYRLGIGHRAKPALLGASLGFKAFKVGRTVVDMDHCRSYCPVSSNVSNRRMHILRSPAIGRVSLRA